MIGHVRLSLFALAGAVLSCGPATPPATAPSAASAAAVPASPPPSACSESAKAIDNPGLGYRWQLPCEWTSVPLSEMGLSQARLPFDAHAARKKDAPTTGLLVLVTRFIAAPGSAPVSDAARLAELERIGAETMSQHGVQKADTRRVAMLGGEAVEVEGTRGDERITMRLLNRGQRQFQFRCLSRGDEPAWPCESALASFVIQDPGAATAQETPSILHLRDRRFGVEFDAPDDSWLAVAPRVGGNGGQVLWIWRNADRQIDLQVLELGGLPVQPKAEQFVDAEAQRLREKGETVTVDWAMLAGERCPHLSADGRDGWKTDMFGLVRTGVYYAILISQRERDTTLVQRIPQRLRLTPRSP